jgi:hypothetical protein
MKRIISLLAITLIVPNLTFAAILHGVTLPDADKVDGKSLVLNGLGTRFASFLGFPVKVYVAGLYVEKKTSKADEISTADSPKKIVMEFLRDVSKEKISKSWEESFDNNCKDKCSTHQVHLKKFVGLMKEMKEKDRMTLIFHTDRLEFAQNDARSETISNAEFSDIILSIFIGPNPPNKELRDGLLGTSS